MKSWTSKHLLPEWFTRCKYYMLEFLAALLGITVVTFLLDRALFVLAHYSMEGAAAFNFFDRMNLSVAAMLLVWAPIALLFYRRSRFEELNRPQLASTKLRRFFLYVFMLIMLLSTVAFTISVLYSLLLFVFGAATVSDTLMQQTVPALVAATIHAYVFRTFMRANTPHQINEFAGFMGIVSTVIFVALIVVTSVQARGALVDEKISNDLREISRLVDLRFQERAALPESLDEVIESKTLKERADKYAYMYEKTGTDSYKLCAVFRTEGTGSPTRDLLLTDRPIAQPALYPDPEKNFEVHSKGMYCFTLLATGSIAPMPAIQDAPAATRPTDNEDIKLYKNLLQEDSGDMSY